MNNEYTKSKDLLGRYQRDRQEMKRRMKSKVEMIQKQEEILSSKEISSTEIQERLLQREMEHRKVEENLGVAKMELDKANERLNENKKTMTNNQQVSKIQFNKLIGEVIITILRLRHLKQSYDLFYNRSSHGSIKRLQQRLLLIVHSAAQVRLKLTIKLLSQCNQFCAIL